MSQVRIGLYELEEFGLPDVCMKCGAKAVARPKKTFAWSPPWIAVLILLGLLPYVVVALILTKRVTAATPFCARHRNYWRTRSILLFGGLLGLPVLGIGGPLLLAAVLPKEAQSAVGFVCAGAMLAGLVWVITVAVVQQSSIRPNEITDRSIIIAGVARDFVDAVNEAREGQDGADDRPRRRRRRDEEGGYSDRDEGRPPRSRADDDER